MKPNFSLRILLSVLLSTALVSCGGGGSSSNPGTGGGTGGGGGNGGGGSTAPSTVAVVILENTSYETVVGTGTMPFLNSLIPQGALATQYFANTHPSIGNYFMLTTGQIITNNDAFTGAVPDDNIIRRVVAANKTWKGYFQTIPSVSYTAGDRYPYIKHHNPFAYFDDVTQSTTQTANIVPLTQLTTDETANTFPNFMFIVPDNEHNAHDCPNGSSNGCLPTDKLAAADTFLSNTIGPLLNNATFKQNGVLLITFDEGDAIDLRNGGGRVVMLALGSHVKAGTQSATMYLHPNALRSISDILGVPAPGAAATAAPMSDLFQ